MNADNRQCKVFSKEHSETPIAVVTASIFENGPFWHGSLSVSTEEIPEFGLGVGMLPEFLLQLDDGRTGTFVENRREVRIGERCFRVYVMGTRALE